MKASDHWIWIMGMTSEALRDELGLREDQDPVVWITRLAEAAESARGCPDARGARGDRDR